MAIRNPLHLPRIEEEDIPILLKALKDILHGMLTEEKRADTAIRHVLRNGAYSAEQRSLIVESGYAMLRTWEILKHAPWKADPKPLHYVALWFTLAGGTIPQELRNRYMPDEIDALITHCETVIEQDGIFAFFPAWFNERCIKEIGKELWHDIAMSQIAEPRVFLRTNTLVCNREGLIDALAKHHIKAIAIPVNDTGIEIASSDKIFTTDVFRKGMFEMQDIASQMIAPMLHALPGQRIIDACAGEGGKTLHISALMQNKGRLIAMDIHEYKLEELKRRARRAGAWNIETRLIASAKEIKKLKSSADAVLIDAPCSGTGVLKRNPDTLMKKTNASIDELIVIQNQLLDSYNSMVKPGGVLVYASCSILPSEGEDRIAQFLASEKGQNWTLDESRRWCPAKDGFDGFYGARLRRSP
ncbi:MAG: RsmB/NOP family class I SAM-dependent RNA methyltransferase [Ignavibacteria bacterium]